MIGDVYIGVVGSHKCVWGSPQAWALVISCSFFSFQAIQILLSLIIVGLGIILAFNFIFFSKKFPLVILTGYPFWGAFIVSTTY